MTVTEIEKNIQQLSLEDFNHLMSWISDYKNERWDKQIEENYKAGKLNKLISSAIADIENGKVKAI